METKDMSLEQKREKLRTLIKAELNLCNADKTPYICAINSDADKSSKLINDIIEMIEKYGFTVGQCITHLERDYNPNMIDD